MWDLVRLLKEGITLRLKYKSGPFWDDSFTCADGHEENVIDATFVDIMVQFNWICRRMFGCNAAPSQLIEEIAWEYGYWIQRNTFVTMPSPEAMLTQCAELREIELGRQLPKPNGTDKVPPQELLRSTDEVVKTQYHHLSAGGY